MRVTQIRIDFHVTEKIKRLVYVYLIETEDGCVLIDSGVAGSEEIIETAMVEIGHQPCEIKAVFLTHAHPDHIGTANYFREKYGAKIYASEGERVWIENIDLQFEERPIPNFYHIAGQSTIVDQVVKDGDIINLSGNTCIEVIGTPGHSADEVSYRLENMIFIGDTVPVRGDIPIFINVDAIESSLNILVKLPGIETFYPAWDQTYSMEMIKDKIENGKELINELKNIIYNADRGQELPVLTELVCERLHMPVWKNNPLFAGTVASCRRKEK